MLPRYYISGTEKDMGQSREMLHCTLTITHNESNASGIHLRDNETPTVTAAGYLLKMYEGLSDFL